MKQFPWLEFIWLIITAVLLYVAKWPILLGAAIVGFCYCLFWLCDRYPRTMFVIVGLLRGLFGRR